MAQNGNGNGSDDLGALRERVRNFGDDLRDLKSEVQSGHHSLGAQIKAMSDHISASQRPQYPLLVSIFSVGIAFVSVIGYLAYSPIQRDTGRLESALMSMPDRYVSSRQYEADVKRELAHLTDMNEQVQTIRRTYMRREDFDTQHSDLKVFVNAQLTNLQRLIETLQKRLDDIWTTRDAIVDVRQRVERIERKP